MKTPTCFLIFFFLAIGAYANPVFSQQTTIADTAIIEELNRVSFDIIKEHPDSAQKLAMKAIHLSKPINYLNGLGDAYVRLGIIEKDRGNFETAIQQYKKSLAYRQKIGNLDLIARVYNNIGSVFTKQSQYDSAAFYLLNALRSAEKLGLKPAQAMYSMNLGIAYEKNKDFDLAINYNQKAYTIYESEADSAGMLKCLINRGGIYFALNQFDKALPVYRKAVGLAKLLEDEFEMHLAIGDLAVTFMNLNQNDSARYYMRQSLEFQQDMGNITGVAIDMSNLGLLFLSFHKPDSALNYFKESFKLAESAGDIQLAAKNATEIAGIFFRTGDYKNAYVYQQKFITYHDSVFNESKSEAIADMQTKYETEKKESEIRVLNKDKEIQQKELDRKSLFQKFLFSAIILIIVIFGLIFNRFKLKKKLDSQIALLNERKRISSELHDDLGAQLSTARMYLHKLIGDVNHVDNREIIENSLGLIDGSISDLRRIMEDLQVTTLQDKGIIAATEELVNKINKLQPINFTLAHHDLEKRLEYKMEHHLFRITQELINNTLKYANARNVVIDFIMRDNQVILSYEDDGKGVDLQKTKRGYGLSNIQSRAISMGGEADFDSQPGAGFRTTIEIPLKYATTKI